MKNRQFIVIILWFILLLTLLFMNNQYIQNQNVFEKNVMCKNLYSSQSAFLKDRYTFSYDWMERSVSNIETFYSKEFGTCVVAYKIFYRDNKNHADNDENFLIETIQEVNGNYWLIMSCHNYDKDCFSKRDEKKSELK